MSEDARLGYKPEIASFVGSSRIGHQKVITLAWKSRVRRCVINSRELNYMDDSSETLGYPLSESRNKNPLLEWNLKVSSNASLKESYRRGMKQDLNCIRCRQTCRGGGDRESMSC